LLVIFSFKITLARSTVISEAILNISDAFDAVEYSRPVNKKSRVKISPLNQLILINNALSS